MKNCANYDLVKQVQDKFELPNGSSNEIDVHYDLRCKLMDEELQEFKDAYSEYSKQQQGDKLKSYVEMVDAMCDLTWLTLGTLQTLGVTNDEFCKCFSFVFEANNSKIKAKSAEETKRGNKFDMVKPADFVPPDRYIKSLFKSKLSKFHRNIIIEGSDRTGKTTLIEETVKYIRSVNSHATINVVHFDGLPDFSDEELFNWFRDSIENSVNYDYNIFDRSFLSELVYSKVGGRRNRLTEEQYQKLMLLLYKYDFRLVFLDREVNKEYKRQIDEDKLSYIKSNKIIKVILAYRYICEMLKRNSFSSIFDILYIDEYVKRITNNDTTMQQVIESVLTKRNTKYSSSYAEIIAEVHNFNM